MRGRKLAGSLALVTVAVGMCLVPAVSQDSGREGRGQEDGRGDRGRRGRRERGQGDRRDEFRRRFADIIRERLGASEEEWKVIEPRYDAVREAQSTTRSTAGFRFLFSGLGGNRGRGGDRGGRGFGGRGDRGRPDGERREPESEVGKKSVALQEILNRKEADATAIKKALTALRAARKQAEKDLTEKREHLLEVLTQRQEAVFVMMSILD